MATLNPEHLFEQAERLIQPPLAGAPRQVDLRRAVSAAYYAVFHAILRAVADELIGPSKQNTPEYDLVYRSLGHARLREFCEDVKKSTLPAKMKSYAPSTGFGPKIRALAATVVELQEKRHRADYDPVWKVKTADATATILAGRSGVNGLGQVDKTERRRFLALLTFPPRDARSRND